MELHISDQGLYMLLVAPMEFLLQLVARGVQILHVVQLLQLWPQLAAMARLEPKQLLLLTLMQQVVLEDIIRLAAAGAAQTQPIQDGPEKLILEVAQAVLDQITLLGVILAEVVAEPGDM